MKDSTRESLSYFGLFGRMIMVRKTIRPERVSFGSDKRCYFLYYEPETLKSDIVIVWVHGGGWNAGSPKFFDFVGQCTAGQGYRFVSVGYRLSPKNKYPCQIDDVCVGYNAAVAFLKGKGIDTSRIVVSGPSAGAHLTSILCYSRRIQEKHNVDVSGIIGYIGVGGPYSFSEPCTFVLKALLDQLFEKNCDRSQGEPCALMEKSDIPALLIHSEHDGVLDYSSAERFLEKAKSLGNKCELYTVVDKKNTHSWYTAGMFLETREKNKGLDKFFSWIENLGR